MHFSKFRNPEEPALSAAEGGLAIIARRLSTGHAAMPLKYLRLPFRHDLRKIGDRGKLLQ
jgi:hypothetical protein